MHLIINTALVRLNTIGTTKVYTKKYNRHYNYVTALALLGTLPLLLLDPEELPKIGRCSESFAGIT